MGLTDTLKIMLLQHSQQFSLQLIADAADFILKNSASMRGLWSIIPEIRLVSLSDALIAITNSQAKISRTTLPSTSVSRKSRPP
jgi:hypothetical protein